MDVIREKRSLFSPQSRQGKKDSRENWATSHSLIWIPFISFSYLIAVAKISNTMLNRSGEGTNQSYITQHNHESGALSSLCNLLVKIKSIAPSWDYTKV